MGKTNLKQIVNNVVYVEPNYINSMEEYGVNGLNTFEFAPALEDYCLYVNLEVEVKGRNVQTSKSSNDKTYVLSFVSSTNGKTAINFMQGSKIPIGENGASLNSLTTNYTDIYLSDIRKHGQSTEMFGIKSIDIAYNNWMVPEVTIEFVDVRGAGLFAIREMQETSNTDKAINGNNEDNIADSFFQCFFTFPYPKFMLYVKGFYGQPVTYELTCADFRARFDSSTGNFACTAKFVGYSFSFLNDVMMNGIVAAPYSDYIGAAYWEKKEFKLKGNSGGDVNIPKIGWLLSRMKDIEATAEKIAQSDPTAQEKTALDLKKENYKGVENSYNSFINAIVKSIKEKTYKDEEIYLQTNGDNGYPKSLLLMSPNDNNEEFRDYVDDGGEIKGRYEDFIDFLDKYNSDFPSEPLPKPMSFYDSNPRQRIFQHHNAETKVFMNGRGNDDIKEKDAQLYDKFKISVNNSNLKDKSPLIEYKNVYFFHDNKFSETLAKYKKANAEKTEEVEKEIEQLKDTAISEALGFHPTVENLTKIVMAHFETFVRMIFETAKTICNENPSRTIQSLGVSDAYDISDVKNRSHDPNCIVPPFPKVVTEVRRDKSTIREEAWVGDYSGDFREKDLVHGIINGIKEIAKDVQAYENNESGSGGGSEGAKSAVMRYPLTPADMIATSKPYASGGYDINDVSSLLGLVGLRAIQILATTNFKDWGDKAETLGRAEGYNFLADHKLSKEMIDKINTISEDDAMQMMYGDDKGDIKRPGDGTKPWPWRLKSDGRGIISTSGDLDICRVKYNAFSVPFQNLSWNKIKNDILDAKDGNKAVFSEDYINSKSYADVTKKNIFTFDTNINRFSSIAESQLKDIDGIDYYRDKILKECKYNSETYKGFLTDNAKDVIAYIIQNASAITPSDGSCMLPTSKNAFSNKSFKHGYNMDYFHEENPGDGGSGLIWRDGWKDKDGNVVKRIGGDGFKKYLEEFNYRDFTFTEFSGLNPDLSPFIRQSDPGNSIFGQYLYYKQKSDYSKALLFLASIGYVVDYKKIINNFFCKKDKTMAIIPLSAVLFAGALLWAKSLDGMKELKHYTIDHYDSEASNLLRLRPDVQRRFISIFKNWVTKGVEGDSLLRSFSEIKKGMEISLIHEGRTYDEFFRFIPEIEDKGWLGQSRQGSLSKLDGSYKSIIDMLKGELSDDFFRNYITIDEDVCGSTIDFTRGLRLGVRDGGRSSVHACNFALAGCVFSKNSKFFNDFETTNVKVNTGELKSFFRGFLNRLKEEKVTEQNSNVQISQAREPDDSNTDIKIGIYRYCKMLYDKWVAGLSDEEFERKLTMNEFFESPTKYFHFIDAYYNEADFIPMNIGRFCDEIVSCYRSDQYSLLSFLSSVYAQNKLNLLFVQNFLDLGKRENMETMFDTVPYTQVPWSSIQTHPNFIVMYPYESSNYLEGLKESEYENDGFMINQDQSATNIWPEPLKSHNANASAPYTIPAFGVSYGKMYQSYFKDVDVSMDNPTVTEQSIKAQFAIACQNNEGEQTGDRSKLYTYGQDLYSIYSNNSYTCNVTMMGCAWVQPLMYFVLNNVPMFRGTYLIEKVTHHIEPGNMTTKFMGVRMSNVCTRIARDESVRARNNQSGNGEANGQNPEIEEKLAGVDNDCPYKEYPLSVSGGDFETSGEINSDASKIMDAIMERGYSKAQAAGIVGNMMQESKLNSRIVVCDSQGYYSGGLCMWHKQALIALINKDSSNVGNTKYKGVSCSSNRKKELESKLPNASEQVKFLLDSFENDSVFKGWKIKEKLMAKTTPESAAVVFQDEFERCAKKYCNEEARKKYARQFFNNYKKSVPPLNKNADGKVSELANGFLHALNQTSNSSSENVEIGIDINKSSGDTIWLTNAKNSNKFGSVFDMILNAYSSKVSNVTWIIPKGGDQSSVPTAYLVTVKEGSNIVNVKVADETSPNSSVDRVHVSKGEDTSGIHKSFCKALVKKYKSHTSELEKDTNNKLDDYDALFNDDKYKIQSCNEVKAEAGITEGQTGGIENETGYIGDWNVGKYVQMLHKYQSSICEGKGKSRHSYGGCGVCTGVINRALRDSGFGMKYWATYPWDVYTKLKSGDDFVEVRSASSVTNKTEFSLGTVNKGDICLMWRTDKKANYHTCSFDGSKWYSDFIQNSCNVYRSGAACNMEWHLMRHK